MPYLQDIIHKLEVGSGTRYLKTSLACVALVTLTVGYNWRLFRNMGTQEAMDAAQVARNLSEGKGYTTQFIRPLSLYLVKKRSEARFGVIPSDPHADYAQIKGEHPDLANPPVYPCVLAIWMKIYPALLKAADWVHDLLPGFIRDRVPSLTPSLDNPLWQNSGRFWWYPHDFFIAVFNEVLFFAVILLTFFLARRLFDPGVAWLSGILLLCCEWLWRFSVSGLSTMLLMLIFMGLVWCLVLIEQEAREPKWGLRGLLLLAGIAGLLVGAGTLTRYAFGWLIVPVILFFILFVGSRKAALCLITLGVFAVVLTPWMYRNYRISGTPFGTPTFAIVEGSSMFPENKLERSLEPDFTRIALGPFVHKLLGNSRHILQDELPRVGGSWVTLLFLTGLLLGFNSPAIRRLRYFLIMCLAMMVIVEALGRTQLSENSPDFNSENLLVLLLPMIFVYGVSLFYLLLDQIKLLFRGMRYLVIGVFAFVMCLPTVFTFLPPKTIPIVYPPYYPPAIRQVCAWMRENELMMSDIPWAVAWYGDRQCVWTTLNAQDQFFTLNDTLKSVRALYLTPETMDSRFLSQWVRAGEHSWGSFILESMLRNEIPTAFPLRKAPKGFLPEQLFLTDYDRWKLEPPVQTPTSEPAPGKKK